MGEKVLLLLHSSQNKLLVKWQGPYIAKERVGEVDYRIQIPGRGVHLYHVNLLKEWQEEGEEPSLYHAVIDWDEEGRERSQELQKQIMTGLPASQWQLHQIQQVLNMYPHVFSDRPGVVTRVEYHITHSGKAIRVPLHPIPLAMKEALEKQVQSMLTLVS